MADRVFIADYIKKKRRRKVGNVLMYYMIIFLSYVCISLNDIVYLFSYIRLNRAGI